MVLHPCLSWAILIRVTCLQTSAAATLERVDLTSRVEILIQVQFSVYVFADVCRGHAGAGDNDVQDLHASMTSQPASML